MNADGIRQVLREVFGNVHTEIVGGWVSLPCPLSRWTHERGKDSRASAGVSIHDNGVSVFNCYACHNKMPLQGMLRKWARFTGENLDALIDELDEEMYLGPKELPGWDESEDIRGELVPLKQSIYLELYESAAGHRYLKNRAISHKTVRKLQLLLDPCDPADGEERILFPVFGPGGELYGMSGRATNPEAKLKVRDYQNLPKASCVLGAHLITREKPDKILIVEGLFDYANMWNCGQPAVAVMHSSMTDRQAAILRDFALPVYLFYDNDIAGKKGCKAAGEKLFRYVPVNKVRYPDGIKDPGELTQEEVEEMIQQSRLWFPER